MLIPMSVMKSKSCKPPIIHINNVFGYITDGLLTIVDGTVIVKPSYTLLLALGLAEQLQFNIPKHILRKRCLTRWDILWNNTDKCLIRSAGHLPYP
jgi:hypothetical protein